MRQIKFGEGDYNGTENADPRAARRRPSRGCAAAAVDAAETTPQLHLTRETYFGVGKMQTMPETVSTTRARRRSLPPAPPDDSFALQGTVGAGRPGATADRHSSSIKLNFPRQGTSTSSSGEPATSQSGAERRNDDNGTGQRATHVNQIVAAKDVARGSLDVGGSKGLQVFSFTYG